MRLDDEKEIRKYGKTIYYDQFYDFKVIMFSLNLSYSNYCLLQIFLALVDWNTHPDTTAFCICIW